MKYKISGIIDLEPVNQLAPESIPEPQPEPSRVAYGTAVNFRYWNNERPEEETQKYLTRLKELFTWGVLEGVGKMTYVHPAQNTWNWKGIDTILAWFNANNMKLKYHTLVWDKKVPRWFKDLPDDGQRRNELRKHIMTVLSRYKGKISIYDIINEPVTARSYACYMGINKWYTGTITSCFKWAREANSEATLLINENHIIEMNTRRAAYKKLILKLLDNQHKAPIGGIGLECHFGKTLLSDEQILKALDDMAEIGLPLYISEFDMVYTTDEYQAEAYKHAYEIFSNHKAVKQIFMWGFYDGRHWRHKAGLFDHQFNPKPAYYSLKPILTGL